MRLISELLIDPNGFNGIKYHIKILKNKVNIGEIKKIKKYDVLGIINFLKSNFKASDIGCNTPKKPV